MSNMQDHIVSTKAGLRFINAKSSFEKLSNKEKSYVYHFS
jgi:hypothetical protein